VQELRLDFPGEVCGGEGFRSNTPQMARMSIGMTKPDCRMSKECVNRQSIVNNPTSDLRLLTSAERGRSHGFTLIELLIVVGIIGLLLVLMAPAFTTMKGGTDITSAAYTIKGVLDTARTYAKANNTYTWVGFFEEDVSSTIPGTAGTGRLVMSIVASQDGTTTTGAPNDASKLVQVGKLTKLDNVHLWTYTDNPDGTGSTFKTRFAVQRPNYCIGDSSPPDSSTPFQYPVPAPSPSPATVPAAQYKFRKAVQFSPTGEARVNNSNDSKFPQRAVEIGFDQTHGTATPAPSPVPPTSAVAIQVTGLGGEVRIYRQ
jgi:prepilin-type N-terminal cleavage/methylation domain-containing protein